MSVNDDFEVLAGSRSTVVKSSKRFKVDKESNTSIYSSQDVHSLENFKDLSENQHVNITGKVQSISQAEQVTVKTTGKIFKKQEFVIANGTAVCRGVA